MSLAFRPPALLNWFGLQQLPLVTLLLVCWIGAGAIGPPASLHDVRVVGRPAIATDQGAMRLEAPTLQGAFQSWARSQPEFFRPGNAPVPLILVAAHGGGIRAAYWTALVLDCIVGFRPHQLDQAKFNHGDPQAISRVCQGTRRTRAEQAAAARRIFVASGVSGGAVGLYAYARQMLAHSGLGSTSAWVDKSLGRDFAAPTIGWGLFHDLPNHFLGLHPNRLGHCTIHLPFRGDPCVTQDRAAVLEESFDLAGDNTIEPRLRRIWDNRYASDDATRKRAELVPLLLMNATLVGGLRRVVVSAADLAPWPDLGPSVPISPPQLFEGFPLYGAVEVSDALCANHDLRLSTAALIAARFPFVSPSARIAGHCGAKKEAAVTEANKKSLCAKSPYGCEIRAVDGGYVDNTGQGSIAQIWPSLLQMVVSLEENSGHPIPIVMVDIDNHYQATQLPLLGGGKRSASETLIPIQTATGGRRTFESWAIESSYRSGRGCIFDLTPGLHPGLTAPLGWELSGGARDDLRDGLWAPHTHEFGEARTTQAQLLQYLQGWVAGPDEPSWPLKKVVIDCAN